MRPSGTSRPLSGVTWADKDLIQESALACRRPWQSRPLSVVRSTHFSFNAFEPGAGVSHVGSAHLAVHGISAASATLLTAAAPRRSDDPIVIARMIPAPS